MRLLILFLLATNFFACQAQDRESNQIDITLDNTKLERRGAKMGKGRFLAANDSLAIGQIGGMDIVLFDLRSGEVLKSISTEEVNKQVQMHVSELHGEQYFVPSGQENLGSRFVGILPYDFRGLFYLSNKERFVVNMYVTVFNRMDDEDQQLFPCLTLFDENLDNIEVIPFDPLHKSTNSAWINGGFFLGEDRMFTKMMAWQHTHNFDFLEYRLVDDKIYTLSDTLFGVKTDTSGYPTRFHGLFTFNGKNYLNLGSRLYSFEGENIEEGHFKAFPIEVERNFLDIMPLDDNRLVAFAINDYRNDPHPTGWLLVLDETFSIEQVVIRFDLREVIFTSLFTHEESVFVANYDFKNKRYFVLKYEDL